MKTETKGIVDDLANKFIEVLNLNFLTENLSKYINQLYDKGLEQAELKFDMNFFKFPDRVQQLEKYTFENIKGMTDSIADSLRKEVQAGFMNLESIDQVQERIKKVMDVSRDRARMIARTEMNRAENMGHIDGARQTGLKLVKVWSAQRERINKTGNKVPCPICEALDGQKVPLDGKFTYNGKVFDIPPTHPNCACTVLFETIQESDE